jgi:hypothetical protein
MTVQQAIASLFKACGGEDGLTAELGIIHCENGERKLLIPVAVGMIPMGDTYAVAFMTQEEVERLTQKNGKLPEPGDYTTS